MKERVIAVYYDGKKATKENGFLSICYDYFEFENNHNGIVLKFSYSQIKDIESINQQYQITIQSKNEFIFEEIIYFEDIDAYKKIKNLFIEKRKTKNIFKKFKYLNMSKKIALVFSLFPVSILIIYFILFKSYVLIPRTVDIQIGNYVEKIFTENKRICSNKKALSSLNYIVKKIVPANNHNNYKIYIIEESFANAFALPNGSIYITSTLLKESSSAQEVAAIFAHEIAHVEKRHGIQQLVKNIGIGFILVQAIGMGVEDTDTAETIAEIGSLFLFLKFSRAHEKEADDYAIELLHNKKISVKDFMNFFYRVDHSEFKLEKWLSTHPSSKERVENIKKSFQKEKFPKKIIYTNRQWRRIKNLCSQ